MAPREIRVSAIVMRDESGRVLTVRKRGTQMFMLPGGKPEPAETPAETALREFEEELGARLDPRLIEDLGEFRAAAANEADHTVIAHVFAHPFIADVQVAAEIEQLAWVDPNAAGEDQAPLNTEHIFPLLQRVEP